mgnify:CR=1 FL=1
MEIIFKDYYQNRILVNYIHVNLIKEPILYMQRMLEGKIESIIV